jgi:hypothetical protein
MKKRKTNPPRLSLHPMKAEEALAAFIRADPAKVEKELREIRRKGGKGHALPKA